MSRLVRLWFVVGIVFFVVVIVFDVIIIVVYVIGIGVFYVWLYASHAHAARPPSTPVR
jgi:hypothetical protein